MTGGEMFSFLGVICWELSAPYFFFFFNLGTLWNWMHHLLQHTNVDTSEQSMRYKDGLGYAKNIVLYMYCLEIKKLVWSCH